MEIHTIHTQELVQVLQLSSLSLRSLDMAEDPSKHLSPSPAGGKVEKIQPRYLASTTAGFPSRMAGAISGDPSFAPLLVPQIGHNSLEKIEVRLSSRSASNGNRQEATKPMQDEPPSTPKKRSILSATRPSQGRQSQYSAPIASKTLLVGRDSIFALCTNTLVVQAEALVIKNRIEDALNLLDAVGPPDTPEKVSSQSCPIIALNLDLNTNWVSATAERILLHKTKSCLAIGVRNTFQGSRQASHRCSHGPSVDYSTVSRCCWQALRKVVGRHCVNISRLTGCTGRRHTQYLVYRRHQ